MKTGATRGENGSRNDDHRWRAKCNDSRQSAARRVAASWRTRLAPQQRLSSASADLVQLGKERLRHSHAYLLDSAFISAPPWRKSGANASHICFTATAVSQLLKDTHPTDMDAVTQAFAAIDLMDCAKKGAAKAQYNGLGN